MGAGLAAAPVLGQATTAMIPPAMAAAVPLPPPNPLPGMGGPAFGSMAPAVAAEPNGFAAGLQNIAPGLSRAFNGGKPVDPAAPHGRDIFGNVRSPADQASRQAVLAQIAGSSGGSAPRFSQPPSPQFSGGNGPSLVEYIRAYLEKMGAGGPGRGGV
jgi:hypothetical protein